MKLIDNFTEWTKTLFPFDEKRLFIWLGPAGLGDKISCLPAFRHLKKLYPDRKIVLYVEPLSIDIWKACKYIDYIIPETTIRGDQALYISKDDIAIKCWWSFYEHHQKHICKSNIEHICNVEYTDDIPLEYELSYSTDDMFNIMNAHENIYEWARGKEIVGISPAYTMYSRMWSRDSWIKLTNLLKEAGYFVVSLGGNNDLDIPNVDYDMRNKFSVSNVPQIVDIFKTVITLNSGMLHLASVNQDVHITYLNVGQFPAELIVPYRKGKLFYNMTIHEHNCPIKEECFLGHITEEKVRPMMLSFLDNYKKETGNEYPNERIDLMKKYVCWHYCAKILNKYSCSNLITPEMVMEKL